MEEFNNVYNEKEKFLQSRLASKVNKFNTIKKELAFIKCNTLKRGKPLFTFKSFKTLLLTVFSFKIIKTAKKI